MLTEREQEILREIEMWEEEQLQAETNDIQHTYDEWLEETFRLLPEEFRTEVFRRLDHWLFVIQFALQQMENFDGRVKRILNEANVFDGTIHQLEDLKQLSITQLDYLADRQISIHRLYALLQGATAGSGSSVFLGVDIPALILINLRTVQFIAASYGYNPKNPFELVMALKVFRSATLPKRFRREGWQELLRELNGGKDQYFYEGPDRIADVKWLNQFLLQILKGWSLWLFRKKKHQNIPVLSVTIGASANYLFTKQVSDFAKRFYQYRHIIEKNPVG